LSCRFARFVNNFLNTREKQRLERAAYAPVEPLKEHTTMKRFFKGWMIVLTAALGVWGCTQSAPVGSSTSSDKQKSLETKVSKLEDENKSVTVAREQLRKKLAEAEEQKTELQKQLDEMKIVCKERDELKTALAERTEEKVNLQNQFEDIHKALRNIVNQADAISTRMGQPPATPFRSTSQPRGL
jgi:septal ring factor EnvC (AmiA/AmiB activator)